MVYRDGNQALLARIDALELELKNLRTAQEKSAEQQSQNAMLKSMVSLLQKELVAPQKPVVLNIDHELAQLESVIKIASKILLLNSVSGSEADRARCRTELKAAEAFMTRRRCAWEQLGNTGRNEVEFGTIVGSLLEAIESCL